LTYNDDSDTGFISIKVGLFVRSKLLYEIRIDRISEKVVMNGYSSREELSEKVVTIVR
jgi:hypothetical protein